MAMAGLKKKKHKVPYKLNWWEWKLAHMLKFPIYCLLILLSLLFIISVSRYLTACHVSIFAEKWEPAVFCWHVCLLEPFIEK